MKKIGQILRISILEIALLVLGVVGIVYLTVTNYYTDHFFRGTTINGIDCSNMTIDEVKDQIQEIVMTYALNIHERGEITERLTAEDMGMTYADDGAVDRLMEQQDPSDWIHKAFSQEESEVSAAYNYDPDKTKESLAKLECFKEGVYVVPADAYINITETAYEIVPEVEGTQLQFDTVYTMVCDALNNGRDQVVLEEGGCYLQPAVRSTEENMNNVVNAANKILSATLTYDFEDNRVVTVDAAVIMTWLKQKEDGSFTLNEKPMKTFVKEKMECYNTLGKPHKFTTTAGKEITLKEGFYGWRINQEKTVAAMKKQILKGEAKAMTPVYKYTGYCRGVDDIGKSYVEVDIDHQKMYLYIDGKKEVDTDVVTGMPTEERHTPSYGIWSINYCKRDADLGTINGLGYDSHVDFWMPFNHNVGIHDSDWRSSFGGEIYKTNGSHGCVNTPYDAAKKIFNLVKKGMPVIVYGGPKFEEKKEDEG